MKRRIISLLLVLCMLVPILPTSAIAADNSSLPFTDVETAAWYYEPIEYVYSQGLMNGMEDNLFAPRKDLTRAMFVTILGRLDGVDTSNYASSSFSDVTTGLWYSPYVEWAASNGIVTGYEDGTFAPGKAITREQMSTIIARYVQTKGITLPDSTTAISAFKDISSVRFYALEGLELMRSSGIITGDEYGNFNPDKTASRAEAATIFMRLYNMNNQSDGEENLEITEEDAQKMISLIQEINAMDKNNATASEIKKYLESIPWMDTVYETPDGGISCRTSFGVTGVWSIHSDDYISGGGSSVQTYQEDITSLSMYELAANSTNTSTSNGVKIVILCPYASSDKRFRIDGYKSLASIITQLKNGNITILKDGEVNLSTLKSLDAYDIVLFYSHGALSYLENSAWAITESDPYTMTGEFANSVEMYVLLSSDFFYGRTVVDLSSGRIGIGGGFYKHYYSSNQLSNMFFHFGSCNSMRTDKLADGILSRGAAWVEGWSNSVTFNNDYEQLTGVVTYLCEGHSASESVSYVNSTEFTNKYAQNNCKLKGKGSSYYLPGISNTGQVYGTTINGDSGEPISAEIRIYSGDNLYTTVYSDSTTGAFTAKLPVGDYTFTIAKEGFITNAYQSTFTLTKDLTYGFITPFELYPIAAATFDISGIVLDEITGLPVANATVEYGADIDRDVSQTVKTDSSGRFTLSNLTDELYWWLGVYETDEYSYSTNRNPTAHDNGGNTISDFSGTLYVSSNSGTLYGIVFSDDGDIVGDIVTTQQIVISNNEFWFYATVGVDGYYGASCVPGTYNVSLYANRYKEYRQTVTISDGGLTVWNIELERK